MPRSFGGRLPPFMRSMGIERIGSWTEIKQEQMSTICKLVCDCVFDIYVRERLFMFHTHACFIDLSSCTVNINIDIIVSSISTSTCNEIIDRSPNCCVCSLEYEYFSSLSRECQDMVRQGGEYRNFRQFGKILWYFKMYLLDGIRIFQ